MKKQLIGLLFVLVSFVSFGQKQRTTAMFDADTTTRPKAGFYGIGIRSGNIFIVPNTGITKRLVSANTHFGISGQFIKTSGTLNSWSNIVISDVTNLQTTLNGKESVLTFSSPLSRSTNTISIPAATSSVNGYLTSADWSTFNGKFGTPSGLTTNYLQKWNGSGLVNSLIFDNGTNVGIGTASPSGKLNVFGGDVKFDFGGFGNIPAIHFFQTDENPTLRFIRPTGGDPNSSVFDIKLNNSDLIIYQGLSTKANITGLTERMVIKANGYLGLATALPLAQLHVNGSTIINDNLGIGTTTPAASAKLDITSTTKGVLLPRLTTTQINAISTPANGLFVYNTTLNKLCVYENSAWRQVTTTAM